jgi:hypothetical protein
MLIVDDRNAGAAVRRSRPRSYMSGHERPFGPPQTIRVALIADAGATEP